MSPATAGAVTVKVKLAVPPLPVTVPGMEHVSSAPAALGIAPQLAPVAAVATTPDAIGKAYESKSRDKLSAPSKASFYYSTDPVKVKLPYADTGEFIVEVTEESEPGVGC